MFVFSTYIQLLKESIRLDKLLQMPRIEETERKFLSEFYSRIDKNGEKTIIQANQCLST
jgi:hypothetical protein